MKTEALIRTLAADTILDRRVESVLTPTLLFGGLASIALLFVFLGPRPDIADAYARAVVLLKPLLGVSLAGTALAALVASTRPADSVTPRLAAVAVAPGLAALSLIWALLTLPTAGWFSAFLGQPGSIVQCLLALPLLSLPLLIATLVALRRGASLRPRLTGGLAGVFAGGLGVVVYAVACTEDSPLFYAIWYAAGVTFVGLFGAFMGPRVLRF